MSKSKSTFRIGFGVTLRPRDGGRMFIAGDEAALRAELSADEIEAMIHAGHLVRTDEAPDAPAVPAAPVAAPAKG